MWVKAAKPEPPLALPVSEVSVEVWREAPGEPRAPDVRRPGFLGLGSNIGDRRAHLEAAVAALGEHGVTVLASSSVYETEPVGLVLDQREFYNACLRVETELEPEPLLDACKAGRAGRSAVRPAASATGRA